MNIMTSQIFNVLGICPSCRKKMSKSKTEETSNLVKETSNYDNTEDYSLSLPPVRERRCAQYCYDTPETDSPGFTPGSEYIPTPFAKIEELTAVNALLKTRDHSPVRYTLRDPWDETSDRTKRQHLRKVRQGITSVLQTIAPGQESLLWKALKDSEAVEQQLEDVDITNPLENQSVQALVSAYETADDKETKTQILSIFADIYSLSELQLLIPEVNAYKFRKARLHLKQFGRGNLATQEPQYRVRMSIPKVDHFISFISSPNLVQDVAYGSRTIRLSSGESFKMPNVVRTMIASRIIKQYEQYCKEVNFGPLSTRELYRILQLCPAQQRKSLQGLDNTMADGVQGINQLEKISYQLLEKGLGSEWQKQILRELKSLKNYLKGDYKLHISESSECADHCIAFALSDPKNPEFSQPCQHSHTKICENCNKIEELSVKFNEAINEGSQFYSEEEKDDISHDVKTAFNFIRAWKSHILRSVNQDRARQDVLNKITDTEVFVTQDFAMKFIPRKFKETQKEWFAKRGISWHISYCVTKNGDEFNVAVYSHLFNHSISQNSTTVASVMRDTMRKVKQDNPQITKAFYRSDCAGAYESGGLLVPVRQIGQLTGITVGRYDLSEPQSGKGACDRSAAHQKTHVSRFLNEGNDICTASDLKSAIDSYGGVKGCNAIIVEIKGSKVSKATLPRIPEVSYLHNFEYKDEGLTVWKAYGIGKGKCITWTELEKGGTVLSPSELIIVQDSSTSSKYSYDNSAESKQSNQNAKDPGVKKPTGKDDEDEEELGIFLCPEEGCASEFLTYNGLDKHLATGSHKFRISSTVPLSDIIKKKWADKFESNSQPDCTRKDPLSLSEKQETSSTGTSPSNSSEGWALKFRKNVRFSAKVRSYLNEKFTIGEITGNKFDPQTVANDMRIARDEQGNRMFAAKDCLTNQQVKSYFSRLAAAKRKSKNPETLSDEEVMETVTDMNAEESESELQRLRADLVTQVSHPHPITYNQYNLCQLIKTPEKFRKRFSISMLHQMCQHFGINVTEISQKRKEGFVAKIKELASTCSCSAYKF